MKKIWILLLIATIFALCVTSFVACKDKGEEDSDVVVTFYPNNGQASVIVLTNGLLHSDVCPNFNYDGYEFAGWCSDMAGTQRISFPYELTEDVDIFGSWVKITGEPHTATFVTNGGTAVGSVNGTTIAQSPSSTKVGYTLDGWYTDESLTTLAHFPYTLDKDTEFYAKFRLSGVAYDTDEEANSLVFKWPAQEGVTYRAEVQDESVEVYVSGGVASFSLPAKEDPFTVTISKSVGMGLTELFRKNFKVFDTFSLASAEVTLVDNDVKITFAESGTYQISIIDPSTDSETVYNLTGEVFYLPADKFNREKNVCFRNVKEDPQTEYYSMRSEAIKIARLETPVFGRYRDAERNISWSAIENANKYTIFVYSGEELIKTEENVTPERTDSTGTAYYGFVPDKLFSRGDYKEFSISVRAEGIVRDKKIILSSGESDRQNVSFIGATSISLVEDTFVWEKVEAAASYDVTMVHNGVTTNTSALREEKITLQTGGAYDLTVRPNVQALNGYTVSATASYELLELPRMNVFVTGSGITLTWEEVPNASSYSINVVDRASGEKVISEKTDALKRYLTFNNDEFPERVCEMSIVALGDGEYYFNSPASFVTIHRLAKPTVDLSTNDTELTVKIKLSDSVAKYMINYTSIQGYEDKDEEGTGVKEIVFDQKNVGVTDVSFDLKVKAVPYYENGTDFKVTHDPAQAPTFYIDSDEVVKTLELLCKPTKFALASKDTLSWNNDGAKATYEIKLDDKNSEGLVTPINSTSVDIADVLEAYGLDKLGAGNHRFYLRRTLPSDSVLYSDYVILDVIKLASPQGLTLKERVLNWGVVADDSLTGYVVVSGVDPLVMTATSSFLTFNNYNVDPDVSMSGATDIYFRVIAKGDLYNNVLDSDASEAFLIKRLPRPTLSIYDGVLSWEESEGNTYTLYDGNMVIANFIGTSYDVKGVAVGDHAYRLRVVSTDPTVFDSEQSEAVFVRRLTTPVLEKVEYGEGLDYHIGIRISAGLDPRSIFFRFEADELEDNYAKINTVDIDGYVFYPSENSKEGKYTIKCVAVGDGKNYISSAESNTIEYYKLPAPDVSTDTGNARFTWAQNSSLTSVAASAFVGKFNGKNFVINAGEEDNFSYSLTSASDGVNNFSIKAISAGNVSSDVVEKKASKLSKPVLYYNGTAVVVNNKQVDGEKFIYSINGSSPTLSADGVWNIADLSLDPIESVFVVKRTAANYLDSDVNDDFKLRKLEAPELSLDKDGYVVWDEVEYANDYVYTIKTVTRETQNRRITTDYGVGGNVVQVYARAEGAIPSEVSSISVVKLAAPKAKLVGDTATWSIPQGATSFDVYQNNVKTSTTDTEYVYDLDNVVEGVNTILIVAKADNCIASDAEGVYFEKLYKPVIISIAETKITWAMETGADEYECTFNGKNYNVEDDNLILDLDGLAAGEYTFTIKATGADRLDSDVVERKLTRVEAPTLTIDGDNVVWDEVADALYYVVYADGERVYEGTARSYAYGTASVITVCGVGEISGVCAEKTIE